MGDSGLLYLRARYYLTQAGIFTARDPFPGVPTLPVTMQPYLYAAGDPLRYTDPSGEIIPFLIAAGLGGLIAGGIDLGTQLLAMHPQSLSQALRCVNWGQVGIAFAGGAVAGLTGVYLSPQPFKKVLNFALISRNRLIKLI